MYSSNDLQHTTASLNVSCARMYFHIVLMLRCRMMLSGVFVPVCPQRMGVLNVGQRVEEQADFEKIYKNGNTAVFLTVSI